LKKFALLCLILAAAGFVLISCGSAPHVATAPSGISERVIASQSASSATALGALVVIDGQFNTLGRGAINAGVSPALLAISPDHSTLLSLDVSSNRVDVINTAKQAVTGTVLLPGPTISMAVPNPSLGYAAVPNAPINGAAAGAVVAMNLGSPSIAATISIPNAQTVVASPAGNLLLVFSNDSNSVTMVSPLLLNVGNPITTAIPGFDRPVNAVFTTDGSIAYVLNCGAECGGTQASVQILNLGSSTPTLGASVPVDGATIAYLNGSQLWVAGNSPTNSSCAGETTAATTCGRLDTVDVNTMTVTGSIAITDGYHNRISFGLGAQLFIGSYACTNIGNVNNPQGGEVRGCLSIYNAVNNTVVVPPDNGDVTGLQDFTTLYVEYVAEGGILRVYSTTSDTLLLTTQIETGTIVITGFITDVKAVDFF
jgi:hypothetical protein